MTIIVPNLPYERLRRIADEFLAMHHPNGELPVPIEKIVEFGLQLDIVPVPGLQSEFDVDAFITSDLAEIRVDRFIQANRSARYHFSLAHEVAHLLIHQDVFKALQFSTVAEWKKVISSIPETKYSLIEWQAYALAGLILVPALPLKDLFHAKSDEARSAGIDIHDMEDASKKIIHSNIGRYFAVSHAVIARRLKADKLSS